MESAIYSQMILEKKFFKPYLQLFFEILQNKFIF